MSDKRLGKITDVRLGHGGYQDAMLGLHLGFGNDVWGVGYSESYWDCNMIKCSAHCKWTEEERSEAYANIMRRVSGLLRDAKVHSVDKLRGIPVEVEFDGTVCKSFRILTEVL